MADAQESSGLHSLAELRRLAAEESRKQAESAQRARLAAERQRAQIEQARADQERALRQAAESGLVAEIERLERARQVEAEHAQSESRSRRELELALAEERSRVRTHDFEHAARLSRSRVGAVFFGLLCGVGALLALGAYFGAVRPAAAAARVELDTARTDLAHTRAEADANAAHFRAREATLSDRVSQLERALDEARVARDPSPNVALKSRDQSVRHGTRGIDVAPHPPCRDDGDPLNPCLKR